MGGGGRRSRIREASWLDEQSSITRTRRTAKAATSAIPYSVPHRPTRRAANILKPSSALPATIVAALEELLRLLAHAVRYERRSIEFYLPVGETWLSIKDDPNLPRGGIAPLAPLVRPHTIPFLNECALAFDGRRTGDLANGERWVEVHHHGLRNPYEPYRSAEIVRTYRAWRDKRQIRPIGRRLPCGMTAEKLFVRRRHETFSDQGSIALADCHTGTRDIPDGIVDAIIFDPPYGIAAQKGWVVGSTTSTCGPEPRCYACSRPLPPPWRTGYCAQATSSRPDRFSLEPSMAIAFGRYELLKKLAAGGMGQVFLARKKGVGASRSSSSSSASSRTWSRTKSSSPCSSTRRGSRRALNHPNIAQIFDLGEVDGRLLHRDGVRARAKTCAGVEKRAAPPRRRRCRSASSCRDHRRRRRGPRLRAQGARRSGPAARHRAPRRLAAERARRLRRRGEADRLRRREGRRPARQHTATGVLKGKFPYMSPEQADGEEIDARSDIFALGIVLWELLTRQAAVQGRAAT